MRQAPLGVGTRLAVLLLKLHYFLFAPWIIYTIVPVNIATLQLRPVIVIVVALLGIAGVLLRRRNLVLVASSSLMMILVLGKILIDITHLEEPDTAIFLLQFVMILFLMEMSLVLVQYETDLRSLGERNDQLSRTAALHLSQWLRAQLRMDTRLGIASFFISLALLVIGGLASIQVGQLAVLAVLVFGLVLALLFLLTNRREPEVE